MYRVKSHRVSERHTKLESVGGEVARAAASGDMKATNFGVEPNADQALQYAPTNVAAANLTPTAPPRAVPAGWTEEVTEDGQRFYHNAATGESSWSVPGVAQVRAVAGSAELAGSTAGPGPSPGYLHALPLVPQPVVEGVVVGVVNPGPVRPVLQEPVVLPRAGEQHSPDKAGLGLAIGGCLGCMAPHHTCCFVGLGAMMGVGVHRQYTAHRNTVNMPATDGVLLNPVPGRPQQVCAQLWKAGATAPLTEAGRLLVASDTRPQQMEQFCDRVVATLGGQVHDRTVFRERFVRRCRGESTGKGFKAGVEKLLSCGGPTGGPPFSSLREIVEALRDQPRQCGVRLGRA